MRSTTPPTVMELAEKRLKPQALLCAFALSSMNREKQARPQTMIKIEYDLLFVPVYIVIAVSIMHFKIL